MAEPERPILFCVNNPRSLAERQFLLDQGCVCRDCLGICGRCFDARLVVVDDQPIEGETYEEILAEARRLAAGGTPPRPSDDHTPTPPSPEPGPGRP